MQKPPIQAWLLLIMLSIIWGSSFILIKRGLVGLLPWELGAIRIVAAALFLLPVAVTKLHRIERKDWKFLTIVGFVGSLIPAFMFAFAQTQISSSVTGVLNALTPIFTILVGLFFFGQRQPGGVFLGILIGFVGTTLLSIAGAEGALSINYFVVFVLIATLCYGTNLNIIKYHLQGLKPITVTSVSLMIAGPLALAHLAFFTDFFTKFGQVEEVRIATGYIILLGVAGTAIALIFFNRLVQLTEPVFASSVTYLIPVVAVIWGIIDHEPVTSMHIAGMVTIVLGVYIANRFRS